MNKIAITVLLIGLVASAGLAQAASKLSVTFSLDKTRLSSGDIATGSIVAKNILTPYPPITWKVTAMYSDWIGASFTADSNQVSLQPTQPLAFNGAGTTLPAAMEYIPNSAKLNGNQITGTQVGQDIGFRTSITLLEGETATITFQVKAATTPFPIIINQ